MHPHQQILAEARSLRWREAELQRAWWKRREEEDLTVCHRALTPCQSEHRACVREQQQQQALTPCCASTRSRARSLRLACEWWQCAIREARSNAASTERLRHQTRMRCRSARTAQQPHPCRQAQWASAPTSAVSKVEQPTLSLSTLPHRWRQPQQSQL